MIQAVIYDLDDTLFPESDFQKSGRHYIASYLNERGFSISNDALEALASAHPHMLFDELVKQYKLPIEAGTLIHLFRNHKPAIAVYPDVVAVLEKLREHYQLGIITDYYEAVQKNKIDALAIAGYFQHIVYTESLGAGKPDPASFEYMKELMHCKEGEIVYIADNETKDFIGARKAGYRTVKYLSNGTYKDHRAEPQYHAEFEITAHADIIPLLDTLSTA